MPFVPPILDVNKYYTAAAISSFTHLRLSKTAEEIRSMSTVIVLNCSPIQRLTFRQQKATLQLSLEATNWDVYSHAGGPLSWATRTMCNRPGAPERPNEVNLSNHYLRKIQAKRTITRSACEVDLHHDVRRSHGNRGYLNKVRIY
jgi:hypothetical protein